MTPGRRVKSAKSLISAVTASPAAVTSAPQPGYATGSKGGAKWCDATAELESWTTQPAPSAHMSLSSKKMRRGFTIA